MKRYIAKEIDGKWYVWEIFKRVVEKGPYASKELAEFIASDLNKKHSTW